MTASVIVIGGGVGGLTAAHELIERGFQVDLYEARSVIGGKARSQPVTGSGTGGRRDLPGEHGFRFYPRFYRHVIDSMQRTPLQGDPSRNVAGNLRPTSESAIAMIDDLGHQRFLRRRVARPYQILEAVELFFQDIDVDSADIACFTMKILQFFTACPERRAGEYEGISWWDFLRGDRYSAKFQRMLRAVPRTMVAMDPKRGSAWTIGTISMQLILDYAASGAENDRTMAGPTSEMWLEHWQAYLAGRGVQFHTGEQAVALDFDGTRVTGVRFAGQPAPVVADYVVAAVPIDVIPSLISPALGAADPALERLRTAAVDSLVSWMTGIQFFLYEDVPIVAGHTFFPDSPWALTAISQAQFWRDLGRFRRRYGDGLAGGVISLDVSDWETPGAFIPKAARDCTPAEIAHEIWEQLKAALNPPAGTPLLTDDNLHSFHLDADLVYGPTLPPANLSRLLVHPPGSWAMRPEAYTGVNNLFLASDYVRTYTNLASMEGANEAARRAVNALLADAGHTGALAEVWPLVEPVEFDRAKALDRALWRDGKPHLFEIARTDSLFYAADLLRKLTELTGIDAIDDYLDRFKLTRGIERVLQELGLLP